MMLRCGLNIALLTVLISPPIGRLKAAAADEGSTGRIVRFQVRASHIDSRVRSYPEIGFVLETADGRPADRQHAAVDPTAASRGRLVIWLMGYRRELFDRLAGWGLHVIQPHYARQWFSVCCQQRPVDPHCRGNIRLEAATGEDFSSDVHIEKPDGMTERSVRFVRWLNAQHPQGQWNQFLNDTESDLRWERVIVAGASHGATTAARFAKHRRVARVVMLCGPRDQYQQWQALPSATPPERYFGFSHVLDAGWTGHHYCRSWEMLGLHRFGPVVNVDDTAPPYGSSRRLVTAFDVGGDVRRAHTLVIPGPSAARGADGSAIHTDVWHYLFTHPVEQTGRPVARDPACVVEPQSAATGN